MSSNVSLNTMEWSLLQWKQFLAHLIPSQGESEGQKKCLRSRKNSTHTRDSSSARDAKCHSCGNMGHFAEVCHTKPLNTTEEDDTQTEPTQNTSSLDSFFLDMVEDLQNSRYWMALIFVNGYAISL